MTANGEPPFELVWAEESLETEAIEIESPGLSTPVTDAPPMTSDEGDYYLHLEEQIDLLRARDEFVVALEAEADIEDVVSALTASGGALEGYEHYTTLNDQRIVLRRPEAVTFATIDLLEVEDTTGVAWGAPVFVAEESGAIIVIDNSVIVELDAEVDPEEFFGNGFTSWERFVENQYLAFLEEGGTTALNTAINLATDPEVEWASPNIFSQIELLTNDPFYGLQWNLKNTSQSPFFAKNDADSDVEEAWNVTTGSSNVVVAVLDTGVQTNHPDLSMFVNSGEVAGNGVDDDANGFVDDFSGWDFFGIDTDSVADNNPNPNTHSPDDAHGTAVAGVAAAVGSNSLGVAGVSQNSKVLPIRIAGSISSSDPLVAFASGATIAKAVYYAAGAVLNASNQIVGSWRGADVINLSFRVAENASLTAALNWAANSAKGGKGVPVFAASGNSAAGRSGSGTEQYAGIGRTVNLFSQFGTSTWSWVLSYKKDASVTAGEDTVRLGRFVNDDGTNTRWDSLSTPTGWQMSPFGGSAWTIEDNAARAHGTGRYQAKAPALGHSTESFILAPPNNVTSSNTSMSSQLYTWQSSATADTMNLYLWNYGQQQLYTLANNGGSFAGVIPILVQDIDIDVAYPARVSSVIAVGASSDWDYRSSYSQYGSALDLVAPSGGGYAGITTTDITGSNGFVAGDYVGGLAGTSFAAPLAAGTAALMLSRNPNLTASQIRTIMQNGTDKVGSVTYTSGFNQYYGYGRVNTEAAVNAAWSLFVPSTPDLKFTSDWGFSESDNKTYDTTPTLTGTVPEGAYVWIYDGGTIIDQFQVAAGVSTFERTLTSALSINTHNLTIKVAENSTVTETNKSQASNALSVVVANSDSKTLGTESYAARMSETLVVSGGNSVASSTMAIDWSVSPPAITKTGTGTVTVATVDNRSVAVRYNSDAGITQFTTNVGTPPITAISQALAANWSVYARKPGAGASTIEFHASQNLALLDIAAGAKAVIAVNGSRVLSVGSLAIATGGTLDMTDNDMIIRTTSATKNAVHQDVENWIIAGMNGLDANLVTNWDGTGIVSSFARTSNVTTGFDLVALGAIRNSDINIARGLPDAAHTSWGGQDVTVDYVLVKYTYVGDADLDGQVEFDDYVGMDNAFYGTIPNVGWATGDIDYNNVINFDDYSKVDQAFFFQEEPL